MPSSSEIRYTVESFTGTTNAAKRTAIYAQWKTVQQAVNSGVSSLSLPGLSGSLDPGRQSDYRDLLLACLEYLDGLIGEDTALSAIQPMGHTVDFSCRPVNF